MGLLLLNSLLSLLSVERKYTIYNDQIGFDIKNQHYWGRQDGPRIFDGMSWDFMISSITFTAYLHSLIQIPNSSLYSAIESESDGVYYEKFYIVQYSHLVCGESGSCNVNEPLWVRLENWRVDVILWPSRRPWPWLNYIQRHKPAAYRSHQCHSWWTAVPSLSDLFLF